MAVLAVVVLCVGSVAWRWVGRPAPLEDRIPMASTPSSTSSDASSPSPASSDPSGSAGRAGTPQAEREDVVVHVVGAVLAPGVVRLGAGSRVVDAVTAAGGLAPGADTARVNLAAPLVDGSRIVVPAVGLEVPAEVPTSVAGPAASVGVGGAASPAAPVDLNTATAEQLDALPGVGPATAQAILAHREANGPFTSVEQLLDVRGIGEAKLDSLRDLVVVR